MHKFFVSSEQIDTLEDICHIIGDDVKHIYKVLRLSVNDKISINDGQGNEYAGIIMDISKKEVLVKLEEKLELNNESAVRVHLYQGLPKSSKMDLIVQKCTELGVSAITPVITERVVVKGEINEFKKTDRWKRIALEAAKQSKRSLIPEINGPMEYDSLLEALREYDMIIVPYENKEGHGIRQAALEYRKNNGEDSIPKKVAIIIGPEGGFEESEIGDLEKLNAKIVTLGPRILRTETAGFTSLALVLYEFSDLGGTI